MPKIKVVGPAQTDTQTDWTDKIPSPAKAGDKKEEFDFDSDWDGFLHVCDIVAF